MKKWPTVPLEDLCELIGGGTPSKARDDYWIGSLPWISARAFVEDKIVDTKDRINEKAVKESATNVLPAGMVVLVTRVSLGKIAILERPTAINQDITGFEIKDVNKLERDFLFWYLKSQAKNFAEAGHGATVKGITRTYVAKYSIPLPPLPIQRQIVSILDAASELKKKRAEADKKMAEFAPALFHQMFGDPGGNEKGWEVRKLGEVAEINPSKKIISSIEKDQPVSFVPMAAVNVRSAAFLPRSTKRLKEVLKGYTYFRNDDVLLAKITPCFENGKSGIAQHLVNELGFGSTEFIVFRPQEKTTTSDWIYQIISSKTFIDEGSKHMTGTGGQQRVSLEWIKNLHVTLPPYQLQKQFASRVADVRKIQGQQGTNEKKMEEVFEGVMAELF